MFYNIADILLKLLFVMAVVPLIITVFRKLTGYKSKTVNSSIIQLAAVSLITFVLFYITLPHNAVNHNQELVDEGGIVYTNNGHIYEDSLDDISFSLVREKGSERINVGYGNIVQFKKGSRYYYEEYGRIIKRYIIHVRERDWENIREKYGNDIKYSMIE